MIVRLVCLLLILSQAPLILLLLGATGRRAVAFSFVGAPLLAAGLALALLWWWRHHKEKRDAKPDGGLPRPGGPRRAA